MVDTSAWVEFLRATGSAVDDKLTAALQRGEPIGVVDVVRLELLAGARDDTAAEELRRLLARGTALPASSPADHEAAALLYRQARSTGKPVRSLLDCLVAAAALRLDAPLLTRDKDYEVLAEVSSLRLA